MYMGEVNAAMGALKVRGRNVLRVLASPLCTSTPEVDRVQETVGGHRLCALHGILPFKIHTLHTVYIHDIYFYPAGESSFSIALVHQCCSKSANTHTNINLIIYTDMSS